MVRRALEAFIHTLLEERDLEWLKAKCQASTGREKQRQVQMLNRASRLRAPGRDRVP
eukprot:SAG31_NODE_3765_length_3903_cov_1.945846_5_plen_57_part_00